MAELLFQKRKSPVRGKFLLWAGAFFLVGAAFIGLIYVGLSTNLFKVKDFEVRGLRAVSRETLISSLRTEMAAGNFWRAILGSDNILFWTFGEFPERLAALPILGSIKVRLDLGAKKVVIEAAERELFGLWCRKDANCYAFDKAGILFSPAPQAEGVLILRIQDENVEPFVLGRALFADSKRQENVFKVLTVLENYDFTVAEAIIKDLTLEEWEVKTTSGLRFLFSLNFVPENLEGVLKNLDREFDFSKLSYFDFRVENRIYYK